MNEQYTKGAVGPLEIAYADDENYMAIITGKHVRIHVDCRETYASPLPLAQLLSAAPDLVEACLDIESKIVDYEAGRINWRPDDFLFRVRDALTKAGAR